MYFVHAKTYICFLEAGVEEVVERTRFCDEALSESAVLVPPIRSLSIIQVKTLDKTKVEIE